MAVDEDLLLLIISSPSGAGKTTLTKDLLAAFPDLTFSVSHTTRKPRSNEVDGRDYFFTDRPDFERLVQAGAFAEWAEVHGNLYGTSLAQIAQARALGKAGVLFDIDHQGARQIKSARPHAVTVFVLPPTMDELKRRLRARAADDEATILERYHNAQLEIAHYAVADYIVVNADLDHAKLALRSIVHAERARRWRSAPTAERLLRTGSTSA